MKKLLVIGGICFLFMYASLLNAQWAMTYGGDGDDRAFSIDQTSDGGYIIAGYTDSFGLKDQDCWVLKLDQAGFIEWQKSYGDEFDDDQAHSVQQTADGGYVVAGWIYWGGMAFSPYDFWTFKLDRDGNFEWQEFQGDIHPYYHSDESAYSVFQTKDGGYIVAGQKQVRYDPPQDVSFRFNVLKLDAEGQPEWQNFYGRDTHDDKAGSIQQTADGGYIVAGSTKSRSAGRQDFWILKLNEDGRIAWQRAYGGTDDDYAESIQQTKDGGYIVAGVTESFGVGGNDFWVLKLDSDGIIEWEKTYGGSRGDYAHSIQQTKNSEYIVAGATRSFGLGELDMWILKLDRNGKIKWQRTYGGDDYDSAFSVQQTNDGGYVVAGSTESFGAGNKDIFVLKLDPQGWISSICDKYSRKSNAMDTDSLASVEATPSSYGGGFFEWGETFVVPKTTNASFGKICRPIDPVTLTISSERGGTTDPVPGTYTHPVGTEVTVIAHPNNNYQFAGWTGDVLDSQKSNNPLAVTMDTSKTIKAHFVVKHTLMITSSNYGTTDPSPGVYSYAKGTDILIQALPERHSRFVEWSGDIPSGEKNVNPITIRINRDKSVRADFIYIIYAPGDFSGVKVENRSFSQIEYINILEWERNPSNRNITGYRIYQVVGNSWDLVMELNSSTFEYWHRNVDKDKPYTYALVAINSENQEGEAAFTTVQ